VLVTWAQAKDILTLDDDMQDRTEFLIASATAQAEKYAGRILAAQDVDIKLDAKGGRELLLPSFPVNSIVQINIDMGGEFLAGTVLTADEYSMENDAGIIRLYHRRFPRAYSCVLFEGNIGYQAVPADLQQAAIEVVSANIRRLSASGGQIGIKSLSANGGITTNYEIDIPVSARNVFLGYRAVRV
jgi:uncharacterized phiE125 gp8 family phage protein